MVKRALLAMLLAGCGENVVVINLVIDGPPPGSLAAAFPDLDSVEMSVALAGEPLPLVTRTFQRGEDLELPEVPYGENLVIHMIGRIGSTEVAAGRTCSFAVRTDEDPPSPHLYFARIVKWAEFAISCEEDNPCSAIRDGATALTDLAGNGLYIGGVDPTALPISGIDRFDTMQGQFEAVAQVEPRRNGNAAPLGDGRIVIAGGTLQNGNAARTVDIVDLSLELGRRVDTRPATGALATTLAPAMVSTTDGRVVTFGGADDEFPNPAMDTIVEINANAEQRLPNARLNVARKQHTATRMSDDLGAPILIIGGLDVNGEPVATAELYRPLVEEIVPAAQFAPMMITPRRDHKAVRLPDGSVLVIGGVDNMGNLVKSLELFTFDSGFQPAGTLPDEAGLTDFTVTPLPDGSVLLAGGRSGIDAVAESFIIRLSNNRLDIVTTDRLTTPRARHQATLLCDGTVMLVGGTLIASPAERYNPPSAGRR